MILVARKDGKPRVFCPIKRGKKFVKRAKEIYGDLYSYDKVIYIHSKTPVTIVCKIHGNVLVIPNKFLSRKNGCVLCSLGRLKRCHNKNTESFRLDSQGVHGDKYDYADSVYTRSKDLISIKCNTHGLFRTTPSQHVKGVGCPDCYREGKCFDTESFILKANSIHGDKYDYSQVNYIRSISKVKILCKFHGVFEQTPNAHLVGQGCPKCNVTHGWSRSQWVSWCTNKCLNSVFVYIIRLVNDSEVFYKFGITSNFNKRFENKKRMPYEYELVRLVEVFDFGMCYDIENQIKKNVYEFKYTPLINFKGSFECFTKDGLIIALKTLEENGEKI